MDFIPAIAVLSAMGAWVLCQIFFRIPKMKAKAEAGGTALKPRTALYWIIVAAQILFLIYCLHRLYRLIAP